MTRPARAPFAARPSLAALPVVIVLGVAACSSEDGPGGALERALAHTRPMPAVAAPSPASGAPSSAATPDGPRYRLSIRAELRLDVPDHAQRVSWTRTLDRQGPAYRFVDQRGWERPSVFADPSYRQATAPPPAPAPRRDDDRLEALFDGTRFALRHADGPWIAREVLDGLPTRMLAQALDLTELALGGFGDYLQWDALAPDADHPPSLVGLPVTWSAARLDTQVTPVDASESQLASWRDHVSHWRTWLAATHTPTSVSGRLARRALPAHAAEAKPSAQDVLAVELVIDGTALVEGVRAPFHLELHQDALPLPPEANFDWPAEVLPVARPRPWHMIRDVLGDDLASPYAPPDAPAPGPAPAH